MERSNVSASPLHALATGVAWLNAALRITGINPAFAEQTGFGESRLRGETLAVLAPHGARLHTLAERTRHDGNTAAAHAVTVCAAPGREARLDFTLTPIADGVLVEAHPASVTATDGRTAQSLRGFAHEIRNPLAAISGAAQLLQRGAADTRQRELATLIVDEASRLATLSERLLGTRAEMATRSVNVHAVLERVANLLVAERQDVTVVRDYDPSLPAWRGDPDRLLQAVLNLARNAIEAHAAHVVLRSRAEAGWRDAHGQRVPALRIQVEDDGDGVPDAIAATLFEPMVSGRAGGTGLGLALAREIAREHGGDLTYAPRARGACFTLRLPRRPHAAEAAV